MGSWLQALQQCCGSQFRGIKTNTPTGLTPLPSLSVSRRPLTVNTGISAGCLVINVTCGLCNSSPPKCAVKAPNHAGNTTTAYMLHRELTANQGG